MTGRALELVTTILGKPLCGRHALMAYGTGTGVTVHKVGAAETEATALVGMSGEPEYS